MSNTVRTPPRRSAETAPGRHDEIVAAAARLFHRNGFTGTSLQQIADDVGILKGSLYHHIRSKADLLHRVIGDLHDRFMAVMADDERESVGTPAERVGRILDRHLDLLLEHRNAASVYRTSMDHLETATRRRLMRERGAYERHVARLVAAAQADGDLRCDIEPALLTSLAFAAVNVPSIWPPGPLPYPRDAVRYAVRELLEHGVHPPPTAG